MVTWFWFTCPSNRTSLIDNAMENGTRPIVCENCDFWGYVDEGILGEEYFFEDEFAYLKG